MLVSGGAQPGERYGVKVFKLADFGAFVKFPSGHTTLLHISEIAHHKVRACSWGPKTAAPAAHAPCTPRAAPPGSRSRRGLISRACGRGLQRVWLLTGAALEQGCALQNNSTEAWHARQIRAVEDELQVGQTLEVLCIGRTPRNTAKVSRRALLGAVADAGGAPQARAAAAGGAAGA